MNTGAMSDEVTRAIHATKARIIYYKEKESLLNMVLADLNDLERHMVCDEPGGCTRDQDCEAHLGDCSL